MYYSTLVLHITQINSTTTKVSNIKRETYEMNGTEKNCAKNEHFFMHLAEDYYYFSYPRQRRVHLSFMHHTNHSLQIYKLKHDLFNLVRFYVLFFVDVKSFCTVCRL